MFDMIIMQLQKLGEKRHQKSREKLCNCGVYYIKNYYIIYIISKVISIGYMTQCGIN